MSKDLSLLYKDGKARSTDSSLGKTPALIPPIKKDVPFNADSIAYLDYEMPPEQLMDLLPTPDAVEMVEGLGEDFQTAGPSVAFWDYSGEVKILGDEELVVLANASGLHRNPQLLVDAVLDVREKIGPTKLLGLLGIATPQNLPFLAYLGGDVFDTGLVQMLSINKVAFEGMVASEWKGDPLEANVRSLESTVLHTRNLIEGGRLREVVEGSTSFSVKVKQGLHHCDTRKWESFSREWSTEVRPFNATGDATLERPDIKHYLKRLNENYVPPEDKVLLLLPCSAGKPYSNSSSHRRMIKALWETGRRNRIHEVILTSPVGVVPRELETLHPAASYDIAVTGRWTEMEKGLIIENIQKLVKRNKYAHVISHLPSDLSFVADHIDIDVETVENHPLEPASISNLKKAVVKLTDDLPDGPKEEKTRLKGLTSYQFGKDHAKLWDGAEVKSIRGTPALFQDGYQSGILSPEKGNFVLTLKGGEKLADSDKMTVQIDDFLPKGDVFAVGVLDATRDIRIGDEVLVKHGEELRAVGVAQLTPWEMKAMRSGSAVKIRHSIDG